MVGVTGLEFYPPLSLVMLSDKNPEVRGAAFPYPFDVTLLSSVTSSSGRSFCYVLKNKTLLVWLTVSLQTPRSWSAVVGWNTLGNMMIGLLVNSEDCHLRMKARGIVECPNLNDERPWACRAAGANCSAAGGAEEACNWPFQIFT